MIGLVVYIAAHELAAESIGRLLRDRYFSCYAFFFPRPGYCGAVRFATQVLPVAMGLTAAGLVIIFAARRKRLKV